MDQSRSEQVRAGQSRVVEEWRVLGSPWQKVLAKMSGKVGVVKWCGELVWGICRSRSEQDHRGRESPGQPPAEGAGDKVWEG